MTSIFEPVNPPKQGPNSNQNNGHLGSRKTRTTNPKRSQDPSIEPSLIKCQRVYLPLPLDPNDHRNQYRSYTFVLVLSDLRFLGGGEHEKRKWWKGTANWVLFVKYFFTVAVEIQENVVHIHGTDFGRGGWDVMRFALAWAKIQTTRL